MGPRIPDGTIKKRAMQKLTKGEEDIMQYLWDLGPCTVSDILEKMEEPRPPHSTVSSVVRILEKKRLPRPQGLR